MAYRIGFHSAGLHRYSVEPLPLFMNFDPSHLAVHDDDIPSAVPALGHKIAHVHVKDARGTPVDYQFPRRTSSMPHGKRFVRLELGAFFMKTGGKTHADRHGAKRNIRTNRCRCFIH